MMDFHSSHSSFREKTLEHVFVGDCLRRLWVRGIPDAEVLRADVDGAGYDIVFEVRGVLRHIQLKASHSSGAAAGQTINGKLATKPSGCVVWIRFDENLALGPFYWFGGPPGEPLPSVLSLKRARHTQANAEGFKAERRNSFIVPRRLFTRIETLDKVLEQLFGAERLAGLTGGTVSRQDELQEFGELGVPNTATGRDQ